MGVYQDGARKWSMLSKGEKRSLIVNTLEIPKYLRYHLARQDDNKHKRQFHTEVEAAVAHKEEPSEKDMKKIRKIMLKACGPFYKRIYFFFRHIFTRN